MLAKFPDPPQKHQAYRNRIRLSNPHVHSAEGLEPLRYCEALTNCLTIFVALAKGEP
jgi:hypothetical protein